jgi:hypothetical protein
MLPISFSFHFLRRCHALHGMQCTRRPRSTCQSPENKPHHIQAPYAISPSSHPYIHLLNIPRPRLTLRNPSVHHRTIPDLQANLERFAIHRKSVRHLITAEAVQDWLVAGFLGWQDFEGDDTPEESGVEFAVGEVGADAPRRCELVREIGVGGDGIWMEPMGLHSTSGSKSIMRRSPRRRRIVDTRVRQISLRVEIPRILEMRFIIMGAVSIHVETRSLRNHCVAPADIADALSRQRDGDDGPEAHSFLDQSRDVGDFFFGQAALPGVVVGVYFVDLGEGLGLDVLAAGGGEVGDAHDEVAGDGVETGGDHAEAD